MVDVGGRRIRRNRVALRTDSPKSHARYQSCHANIEKAETDPEKPRVVPHAVPPPMPDTRMKKLPLDYQSDQSVTRKSPERKIPPSPEVAGGLDPVHNSKWQTSQEASETKPTINLILS